MRMLWLTDLHVDRMTSQTYQKLLTDIQTDGFDALGLTGDIGEPPKNWHFLEEILCLTPKDFFIRIILETATELPS